MTRSTESNSAKQKAWCTENLYEFIPCNLRMPHFSIVSITRSLIAWKDQEKQGVARVVENLECVMWLSMDRSQRRVDERVIDESIIMNNSESDQCAFCHKSKVFLPDGLHAECGRSAALSLQSLSNHELLLARVSGEGLEEPQGLLRRCGEGDGW